MLWATHAIRVLEVLVWIQASIILLGVLHPILEVASEAVRHPAPAHNSAGFASQGAITQRYT